MPQALLIPICLVCGQSFPPVLLISQFLIGEAVRNLAAPVFRLIEAVDGFLVQYLRDFFQGGFLLASQKQGGVAVAHNDFGSIFVDGFQLRLALQK